MATIPRTKRLPLFASFVAMVLPSIAHAWGGDGHQLVCLIAEDRLTPAAKKGIHEMLRSQAGPINFAVNGRKRHRGTTSISRSMLQALTNRETESLE